MQGAPGAAAEAEDHFRQALDWAAGKAPVLGTARRTSLARLRRDHHRIEEARDLLAPVYGRFTEGFATADLQKAKGLLEELARTGGTEPQLPQPTPQSPHRSSEWHRRKSVG